MSEKWLEEIKNGIDDFFKTASSEEIIQSLKEADYYAYTGKNPEEIILESPVCIFHTHIIAQNFVFKEKYNFVASVQHFELIAPAADEDVRYHLAA